MKLGKNVTTLLVIAALALLVVAWLRYGLEPSMLYHPTSLGGTTPRDFALPYREVALETEDGETLGAWWCPRPEREAPLLLFFHGNAGNREDRLHNVAGLWRAGISVLIFDYRGYGGSTGRPSEAGLLADGLAAFDWLQKETGSHDIVLFGRSLGAAVAAQVAGKRPARALILESAFTSAPEMAKRVLPLPGIHLLVRSRFDTLAAVRNLALPLLVIHGTQDELVPFVMGKRIFDEAASSRKRFQPVQGGSHNDTYLVPGPAYYAWLSGFLDSLPRR
ncbi:MAG: alpha/beta hydrolase [SAR324 cluster bacterium]|nr:alpha/beta hydrolase [SAR324 cluster bacterium]